MFVCPKTATKFILTYVELKVFDEIKLINSGWHSWLIFWMNDTQDDIKDETHDECQYETQDDTQYVASFQILVLSPEEWFSFFTFRKYEWSKTMTMNEAKY